MLANLLPYRDCLDWTDETVLKAVKNLMRRNITLTEFDQVVTAHERIIKLRALIEKEEND